MCARATATLYEKAALVAECGLRSYDLYRSSAQKPTLNPTRYSRPAVE
jgi:hypothetical protein